MFHSIGVSGVLADLMWCTAGGSGIILLLGMVGRLALVLDLLLSGVGYHWRVGLGVWSKVSSAHVGCSEVVADGGDTGDSCCLICSGCLDGPLIAVQFVL